MFLRDCFLWFYRTISGLSAKAADRALFGRTVDFYDSEMEIYRETGKHVVGYEQSNLLLSGSLEKILKKEDHSDNSILDIGCGKGRMLFFFYQCGFGRADGVEYSESLARTAEKNYDVIRKRYGLGEEFFRIYQGDAVQFDRYDDYDYFYLYNPFDAVILKQVLEKILLSKERKPRRIVLIYKNPLHRSAIDAVSDFKPIRECNNSFIERKLKQEILIYESI